MTNRPKKPKRGTPKQQKFPRGWDDKRVRKVLAHYENQAEDEAVVEDEAAYRIERQAVMLVPAELVPAIRQLLARHRGL